MGDPSFRVVGVHPSHQPETDDERIVEGCTTCKRCCRIVSNDRKGATRVGKADCEGAAELVLRVEQPNELRAPDHIVRMIAALAPLPRTPTGPTPQQWAAQIRVLADRIWAEAFLAGGAHTLAWHSAPIRLVVGEIPGGAGPDPTAQKGDTRA